MAKVPNTYHSAFFLLGWSRGNQHGANGKQKSTCFVLTVDKSSQTKPADGTVCTGSK